MKTVLVIFLFVVLVAFGTSCNYVEWNKLFVDFVRWIESLHYYGFAIFCAVHLIGIVVCFPLSILFEISAGFLFGLTGGIMIVFLDKLVASTISFYLARTLFRDWAEEKIRTTPRLQTLFAAIGKDSWKIAFWMRVSPIPSWVNNYCLAITPISYLPYIAANIGTFPILVQNVLIGSLMLDVAHIGSPSSSSSNVGMRIGWSIVMIASLVFLSRFLQQNLFKEPPTPVQKSQKVD